MSISEKNHEHYTIYCILTFGPPCISRGSNPGGGEIFRTRPDRPVAHPIQWVPGPYRCKAAGAWR